MKQVLQNLKSGVIEVADVPCPLVRPGNLLIQSRASLISAGTERSIVEFGKGNLLAKARSKPDKVKQVLNTIKKAGLMPTLEAVFSRLDEPMPLGYCNTGTVVEVGEGIDAYKVGDRVISNGSHAEMVCCPLNLCAKVPDAVPDEHAAFTVLGSIALQGVRLLQPTLGETFAVSGLGLIGLMAVQILRANGCRVIGIDVNPDRLELARSFGAETVNLSAGVDPVDAATAFSRGRGVDGVLIAAATKSDEIMKQSAHMCRKRGRIVLVGVVGLSLTRSDFYEKELSFQVSCSYGPGRYDPIYERKGQDYPIGFVRWTEQRNFEAVLDLMASGQLNVEPLINRRIPFAEAPEAYRLLTDDAAALGILLEYPKQDAPRKTVFALPKKDKTPATGKCVVGMIGAGNFAKIRLLPALRKTSAVLHTIASASGTSAFHAGRKFGFKQSTSDYKEILANPDINLVIIVTRHNLHARMVVEALNAGKHVGVEKPLCITREELEEIREAYCRTQGRQLLVGFNRRFAPHIQKMRSLLASRTQPMCMNIMVNAGYSPPDSWVHDPGVGGGRIIGEGCHWIDLMSYLAGSPVVRVMNTHVSESPALPTVEDKAAITITLRDGSIGTLNYFANGDKTYIKEALDVYSDGRILRLQGYGTLRGYGFSDFRKLKKRDKGDTGQWGALVRSIEAGGESVIPFDQTYNVMKATFDAVESAREGRPIDVE